MHADGEIVFQGTFESLLRKVESMMLFPKWVEQHLPSLLKPSMSIKGVRGGGPLWIGCESNHLLANLAANELTREVSGRYHSTTANVYVYLAESNECLGFLVTGQALPILR